MAEKGIAIQPGLPNGKRIIIMNVSAQDLKISKNEHIGNLEPYKDTPDYLTLNEITETEKEHIKILKKRYGTEV